MSVPPSSGTPTPSAGSLARQFATILLLMVSLAISLTFLFLQTPVPTPTVNATIVLVWDGMRPDMATDATTPNLLALGNAGVVALDHHAIFPSTTLVNAAALATGSYPGGNDVTITSDGSGQLTQAAADDAPESGISLDHPLWSLPDKTLSTPSDLSDPQTQIALQGDISGGLLLAPSLAESALAKGMGVSAMGAGGAALIQAIAPVANQTKNAYVVDGDFTFPSDLGSKITSAGVTLPTDVTSLTSDALTQAYLRVVLPALTATNAPFLSVIDYGDAMAAAERSGIGSTAHLDALHAQDTALGEIIDELRTQDLLDKVNLIVTSTHGLSQVIAPTNADATNQRFTTPDDALRTNIADSISKEAALGGKGSLPDVGIDGVTTSTPIDTTTLQISVSAGTGEIVFPETPALSALDTTDLTATRTRLAAEVVGWLQRQPQVGPIFVNDALRGSSPDVLDGTLPMSSAYLGGVRAPAILFTFTTKALDVGDPINNTLGLAGSAYSDTTALVASGTLSRRDMHAILYAEGPSFKSGATDLAPTGVIDLAPTIEQLLDLPIPASHQGRALTEMLLNGDNTTLGTVKQTSVNSTQAIASDGSVYAQVITIEQFGGVTYIHAGYAIHANAVQPLQQVVTDAIALANQE